MDYYLFAARSVTHAQRMARLLSDEGVPVKIRRAGNAITGHGCGYTLEVSAKYFARAATAWAMNSSHGCAAFPQRSTSAASGWKRNRKTSARRPSMPVWAFRRWAIARCSGRKQHDLS